MAATGPHQVDRVTGLLSDGMALWPPPLGNLGETLGSGRFSDASDIQAQRDHPYPRGDPTIDDGCLNGLRIALDFEGALGHDPLSSLGRLFQHVLYKTNV